MASNLQLKYGDEVEIWNSHYRPSVAMHGRVVRDGLSGVTVKVTEKFSGFYRVGDLIRFNANHFTDMIICHQRGKSFGNGLTAHLRTDAERAARLVFDSPEGRDPDPNGDRYVGGR